MKKVFVFLILLFICSPAYGEVRHTFYERYNPISASGVFVYDDTGATTTGDVVDVFTYDVKTVFISSEAVASLQVDYQIEGRCVGELDTWSILDTGSFGSASGDAANNIAVDVTELVDYLRVGLRVWTNGADRINVRGIFRKGN